MQAQNKSDTSTAYRYADLNITEKLVYYRLKMTDRDSTFAYSQIRTIEIESESEVVAYPNPVGSGGEVQLLPGYQGIRNVRVYDLAGKLVLKSDIADAKFSLQDLPAGKYIVQIQMKDGSKTSRTIVKE